MKVPTVPIDGATDPLKPGGTAEHARMFVGLHEHRVVDAGYNLPQQRRPSPSPTRYSRFVIGSFWKDTSMMNSGSASVSLVISGGDHAFGDVIRQDSILEVIADLVVNDRIRPAAMTRLTGLTAETMRTAHENP
ncbi:MAG TPA: hypothetical protein VG168_12215 [Bryobacteraceae bacterium]|nr:hypothetical protein [Bryobacteraceae bacterium]